MNVGREVILTIHGLATMWHLYALIAPNSIVVVNASSLRVVCGRSRKGWLTRVVGEKGMLISKPKQLLFALSVPIIPERSEWF